jgi:hypothetical protein
MTHCCISPWFTHVFTSCSWLSPFSLILHSRGFFFYVLPSLPNLFLFHGLLISLSPYHCTSLSFAMLYIPSLPWLIPFFLFFFSFILVISYFIFCPPCLISFFSMVYTFLYLLTMPHPFLSPWFTHDLPSLPWLIPCFLFLHSHGLFFSSSLTTQYYSFSITFISFSFLSLPSRNNYLFLVFLLVVNFSFFPVNTLSFFSFFLTIVAFPLQLYTFSPNSFLSLFLLIALSNCLLIILSCLSFPFGNDRLLSISLLSFT